MTQDNDERLWLSAERGTMNGFYALSLIGRGSNERIGTITQLAGGGWTWNVGLTRRDGERVTATGEAANAEDASDAQFDALTRLEPERFMRKAA